VRAAYCDPTIWLLPPWIVSCGVSKLTPTRVASWHCGRRERKGSSMNVIRTLVIFITLVLPVFGQVTALPQGQFPIGVGSGSTTCQGVMTDLCIPTTCVRPEILDPALITSPATRDFGSDMNQAVTLAGNRGCVDATGVRPSGGQLFMATPIFQGVSSTNLVSIYWPAAHIYTSVIQMTGIRPGGDIGFPSGGASGLETTISLCNLSGGCGPTGGPYDPVVSSPNYVTGGPTILPPYTTGTISCSGTRNTFWSAIPKSGKTLVQDDNPGGTKTVTTSTVNMDDYHEVGTTHLGDILAGPLAAPQWNDATYNLPVVIASGVASAVDQITVTDSAMGSPATVTVSATGSDSNVNLNLVSKGTGTVKCNGGGCGLVQSVFGRTGAVVAVSGDYTVAQVTGAAPLASPTFTGTAARPHAHDSEQQHDGRDDSFCEHGAIGRIAIESYMRNRRGNRVGLRNRRGFD